ncbi:glycoside hydrolase family 3 protein [Amanita rubescens]|nr:glycoside hydrolase family 3 protein [Amanita rubescens]
MTLDEKIGLVTGNGQLNSSRRCVGETYAVPRLGIPSICLNDGPAGLRLVKNVTGFPSGINTASTFSRRLMRARGEAMAEEFRGKGVNVLLGPAMDIMRNPKAGRGWESFGPDPYLNGEGAYETIMGIQSVGVMACAKHFAANNQEHWRYGLSANMDNRTLYEMYYYPFLRSIEADVSSVMCAYNRFNKVSSCHNAQLLGPNAQLRSDGFKGYVVSDWGATHDSASGNANAGLDMEQPGDYILVGGGVYGSDLKEAVEAGSVSEDRLDQMVARILAPWYRLGQDSGYPPVNFNTQAPDGSGPLNENVNVRSDAHTLLVREIASASAVLLKNNQTTSGGVTTRGLPITKSMINTVAIVGQDAKQLNQRCTGGLNECNDGTMVIGWGSGSNSLDFVVPPVDALTDFFDSSAVISESLSDDLTAGPAAAKGKDVALVFVNAMSGELGAYNIVHGNMGDRNDLNIWFKGGSLVQDVAAVCSNTIVVVHSVGPVYMPWSNHPNITAIIYAGAPGEQTGPSIVDVLSGAYNPRGRLPFSMADAETDYGTRIVYESDGFPTIIYTEKLLLDYRYMDANDIIPRFEFGFGLSYTTFSYSDLLISTSSDPSAAATVSFMITNTGSVVGTEIPQLYLTYPPKANEPKKVLRGFEEVGIAQGQSVTVKMTLTQRDLSIWDVNSQGWVRPAGQFIALVGASSLDIRLTGVI